MTSKTQDTKDAQKYTKQAMQCNNCKNYKSDKVEMPAKLGCFSYVAEKNKRCGIGDFAVQSSASCDLYERAEPG